MTLIEKLNQGDYGTLLNHGPITIVAFGDSVTHGAVGAGEIFYDTVYHNRLKMMMAAYRSYTPVNIINAGIGGINAKASLPRLDAQVLAHNPDLVIVCFGLNDINGPLDSFIASLKEIFTRCQAAGVDVIYMTPNMLNTRVDPRTEERYMEYAAKTADMQNSGRMDEFINAARALCKEMHVPVADAYARWKELAKTEDTTSLLANYINHPTREMHALFAEELWKVIFRDTHTPAPHLPDTMYHA